MSSTNLQAKAGQAKAASKPTDTGADSTTAQLFSHVHPVLLLSSLFLSFRRLVQDPISTLVVLAPITAALQAAYCITCVTETGQSAAPAAARPGQKKKKASKPGHELWRKGVTSIFALILTLTLATPLLYVLVILFGAPLVSHHAYTALLALHLALLTAPALFYAHGLDVPTWRRCVSLQQPLDAVYGMALGACVGAWLGAIPIPLDWDRDWQRWPVTVVAGAYGGAVVGKVLGGLVWKGVTMKMT